jgi:hypothetical protein
MAYRRITTLGTAGLVLAAAVTTGAQRRVPGQRADNTVPVTVTLKTGAEPYDFNGKATCSHAPVASIYDLRAERWTVDQSDGSRSMTLALWHPASGSDLVSLSLNIGNKRYSVSTIKVGDKGAVEGSGKITLAREGTGGTFTVDTTAANGTKITGTVRCGAFTPAIAEGGL